MIHTVTSYVVIREKKTAQIRAKGFRVDYFCGFFENLLTFWDKNPIFVLVIY